MRALLTIIIVISFSFLSSAQGIEFFQGEYKDAIQKAYNEDKLVFVDAYAVWCGPCKRMSAQVFPKDEVGAYFNKHFINMKIDMEKGQGLEFRKTYPVKAFPTFYFIDGEGKIVYTFRGARDVTSFIMEAKKAVESYDGSAKYEKLFAEGDRSYETVFKYIKSLNNAGKSSLKVANEYLVGQDNYTSEENLKLIFEATTEVDSRIFDLLMEHKAQVLHYYSEKQLESKILSAAQNTYDKSIEFSAPSLEEMALDAVKQNARHMYKEFMFYNELQKAERKQDFDGYLKYAEKYHKTIRGNEKEEKNLMTDVMNNFSSQKQALEFCVDVAESIAKKHPSIENYLNACKLHKSLRNAEEARKWAEKALDLGKDDPKVVRVVEQYLQTI